MSITEAEKRVIDVALRRHETIKRCEESGNDGADVYEAEEWDKSFIQECESLALVRAIEEAERSVLNQAMAVHAAEKLRERECANPSHPFSTMSAGDHVFRVRDRFDEACRILAALKEQLKACGTGIGVVKVKEDWWIGLKEGDKFHEVPQRLHPDGIEYMVTGIGSDRYRVAASDGAVYDTLFSYMERECRPGILKVKKT